MSLSIGGGRKRQTFNEINITPLTDVFLVLLVIMFLIAPLLDNQAALKVDPPAAQTAQATEATKTQIISIEVAKDGRIAIDGEVIAEPATPDAEVQEAVFTALSKIAPSPSNSTSPDQEQLPQAEKPIVKLKADNGVGYGRVVGVLDAVNRAQLGKLSLVTSAPKK